MTPATRHTVRAPRSGVAAASAFLERPGALRLSPSRRWLLLMAPLGLIASMYVIFQVLASWLGPRPGFAAAYLVYWLIWGFAVPLWLVGQEGVFGLFRPVQPMTAAWRAGLVTLLAAPAVFGFLFVFPSLFPDGEGRLLVMFAVYAIVNGILEEIFWRGLFVQAFPADAVRGVLYPAMAFGVWHLVVLSMSGIFPPVAPLAAFIVATALALLFAWATRVTGSIRWVAASHVLLNLSGLGAFVVFQPIG